MKWWVLAALCALLQACGGASSESAVAADAACSAQRQRATLSAFMQDNYYWYAQMRAPDESAAPMDAYFRSMLYTPVDRFSYSESTAAYDALFIEGRRTGYGYTLVWANEERTALRVRNVEPLGPAARAGLARGDVILSINGLSPLEIVEGALPPPGVAGESRRFVIQAPSGDIDTLDAVSESYPLSPVAGTAIFDITRDGVPVKVGYIHYTQFVSYSEADLNLAFIRFGQAGVTELILDMRYNGGGSVAASRDLASMIGGARTAGKLYTYLRFNDKQANKTTQMRFNTAEKPFALPLPAGLPRVMVIATGATASASELLINGLRPFVDVKLVGDTTYGKPYGFVPRDICGTTYNAVQFESLNALGVGGFTAGFAPDCVAADDLGHALGDPAETSTHAALQYLATGRCAPASGALAAAKPRPAPGVFGEVAPPGMFVQ